MSVLFVCLLSGMVAITGFVVAVIGGDVVGVFDVVVVLF